MRFVLIILNMFLFQILRFHKFLQKTNYHTQQKNQTNFYYFWRDELRKILIMEIDLHCIMKIFKETFHTAHLMKY